MKSAFFLPVITIATLVAMVKPSTVQESAPEKPKQSIYVLRLVPRLYADANWTAQDKDA